MPATKHWAGLLAAISLTVMALCLVTPSLAFAHAADRFDDSTLRQLAARLHIHVGSAVSSSALINDAQYAEILGQQFSAITPENEMKWASVEARRGVYTFGQADAEVRFAEQHDQLVRGHNLVWDSHLPNWLSGGTFSNQQLTKILKKHILTEVGHFRGEIWQWDVVNEPLNDDGTLKPTLWLNALGSNYIADTLRWAHQADPRAKLFLNDYDIEGMGPKSNGMYALVKRLKMHGIPIDGVGFQAHLGLQLGLPPKVQENLQRFADLGLQVDITEMDVRMTLPPTPSLLAEQASWYAQLMQDCIAVRSCVDFTVWEYTDKYSWIPAFFAGDGGGDLYDTSLNPKPAYGSLINALANPVSAKYHS